MRLWLFTFALLLLVSPAAALAGSPNLEGRVVGVHDGDTITVLDAAKHQTKIRLAEIDAPELKQPYGSKAKQMLSDLVFGKDVTIVKGVIDKYGRTVGRIYQGDTDVNLTMVKQGGAWAYRKYLTDDTILAAEEFAKAAGAGLWGLQDDQRIPPWEWRHGKKVHDVEAPEAAVQVTPSSPVEDRASFACAGKTTCKQMTSCAEAMFYLTQCGLSRLDGDHDGTPCESMCR